jgi:hypothetical protein
MAYILIDFLRVYLVLPNMLRSTVIESKTSHLSDVRYVTRETVKVNTYLRLRQIPI